MAQIEIAALYVDPKGIYSFFDGVDLWGADRDARNYNGNCPVVAHPPCQLWGNMAAINYKRWGGDHNKPGNDGGCFESALCKVVKFGGVLEHPKNSRAFAKYGIDRPSGLGWQKCSHGGWVCEVWQSAYGHKANKATWLYYIGSSAPHELRWERPIGTHQIGFHDQRGKAKNKPTISGKAASATPFEFAVELLRLARNSTA